MISCQGAGTVFYPTMSSPVGPILKSERASDKSGDPARNKTLQQNNGN
jgi:hypothetical protein